MLPAGAGALQCRVWFYSPRNERTTGWNIINKIVAGLSPPWAHVELQFPSGQACSIVMHDTVRMRERTFDTEFYTCVTLSAPPQAVFKAQALAQAHVDRQTPFGISPGHTFCSRLVAELLRDGGLVPAEALADTFITPSALYAQLLALQGVAVLRGVPAALSGPAPAVGFAAPGLVPATLRLQ
jgi:hypothetical protein